MEPPYDNGIRENDTIQEEGPRFQLTQETLQQLYLLFHQKWEDLSKGQRKLAQTRQTFFVQREQLRAAGSALAKQREKTAEAEGKFMKEIRRLRQVYIERPCPDLERIEPFYQALEREHGSQQGQNVLPEASFMSEIRKVIQCYGAHPDLSKIEKLYKAVEEERDRLGELDYDWIQTERKLEGTELNFGREESDFYQADLGPLFSGDFNSLLHRLNLRPRQPQHVADDPLIFGTDYQEEHKIALAELQELRKEFNSLRPRLAEYIEEKRSHKTQQPPISEFPRQDPEFMHRSEELTWKIANSQVKVSKLKEKAMQQEGYAHVMKRRFSEPPATKPASSPLKRAQTEPGLANLLDDLPDTKILIKEWLLDYMKNNPVEKTLYREMLKYFGISAFEEECWHTKWDLGAQEHDIDADDQHSITHPTNEELLPDQHGEPIRHIMYHGYPHPPLVPVNFNNVYYPPPPPPPPPTYGGPLNYRYHDGFPISPSAAKDLDTNSPYDPVPLPLVSPAPYYPPLDEFNSESEGPTPIFVPYFGRDPPRRGSVMEDDQQSEVPPLSLDGVHLAPPPPGRYDSHQGSEISAADDSQRPEDIGVYTEPKASSGGSGTPALDIPSPEMPPPPVIKIMDHSSPHEDEGAVIIEPPPPKEGSVEEKGEYDKGTRTVEQDRASNVLHPQDIQSFQGEEIRGDLPATSEPECQDERRPCGSDPTAAAESGNSKMDSRSAVKSLPKNLTVLPYSKSQPSPRSDCCLQDRGYHAKHRSEGDLLQSLHQYHRKHERRKSDCWILGVAREVSGVSFHQRIREKSERC